MTSDAPRTSVRSATAQFYTVYASGVKAEMGFSEIIFALRVKLSFANSTHLLENTVFTPLGDFLFIQG
jgi:hypothetical protein